jgi:hypothetical protein
MDGLDVHISRCSQLWILGATLCSNLELKLMTHSQHLNPCCDWGGN